MTHGVFAGLTGLDITYYQTELPLENHKSKTNNYDTFVGGPAANAAITYAILGGNATLITCIGDTVLGKSIKSELEDVYNVKVIDLALAKDILPSISSVMVNTNTASRTIWSGQQQFETKDIQTIEDVIREATFCFSDCNLPEVSVGFLKLAHKLNKKIVLDPGSWKPHFPECLPLANEIIASVNCNPPNGSLLDFLSPHNIENIAITNGEKNIVFYEETLKSEIEVLQVNAIDTLAAGDVLHGAYCYYRFDKQLSFNNALTSASIVASESVKYLGAREGVYVIKNQETK